MRKSLWIIPFLFAVIGAPNAHAQTTYTYTGEAFTTFNNPFPMIELYGCPPECSITGSITLPSPIPDDTYIVYSTVFGVPIPSGGTYSFTDGYNEFNPADSYLAGYDIDLTTNSSGEIVNWSMVFQNTGGAQIISSLDGYDLTESSDGFSAAYSSSAGEWTESSLTTTPEPASMLLFGTGLLGIIFVVRKRLFA